MYWKISRDEWVRSVLVLPTAKFGQEEIQKKLISIGNLEMNSGGGGGEMSPLHESALFQPRSIRSGSTKSRTRATVFTCRKCGSTDMEEEEAGPADPIISENRGAIQYI